MNFGNPSHSINLCYKYTNRLIFWTDKGEPGGRNAKIERATTDGRDRTELINSRLKSPRGIAVDRVERRVYWVDQEEGVIESITYDGSDRKFLRRGLQNTRLFDIAIYKVCGEFIRNTLLILLQS